MGTITGVRMHLVKRYELSEPVFSPDKLKKSRFIVPPQRRTDYSFLGDGKRLRTMIGNRTAVKIPGVGTIEPIRNPYASQETYWLPFVKKTSRLKFRVRPDIPILPFHVRPSELILSTERQWVGRQVRQRLREVSADWGIRVYPPGICVVYIDIFLVNPKSFLDLSDIGELRNCLKYMPFEVTTGSETYEVQGIFKAFDWLFTRFVSGVMEKEPDGNYPESGYYLYYSLQGESIGLDEYAGGISRLLFREEKGVADIEKLMIPGKHENDILAIGRKTAVVSVDDGLRAMHENIPRFNLRKARHCFFWQFVFSVEFAYITQPLVRMYERHFSGMLVDLQAYNLSSAWATIFDRYTRRGILDPCVYGTLQKEILTIPGRLRESRGDGFWERVYSRAARKFAIATPLRDLKNSTREAYEIAMRYKTEYAERVKEVMKGTRAAVETMLEVLKTVKPGL